MPVIVGQGLADKISSCRTEVGVTLDQSLVQEIFKRSGHAKQKSIVWSREKPIIPGPLAKNVDPVHASFIC